MEANNGILVHMETDSETNPSVSIFYPQVIGGVVKRHRGVGKESCKAQLIVVKSKYGGYVVTIFDEAHTHPLTTPRRRHLLKSHRRISGVDQLVAQQLISANVSTHQQYDILAMQAEGIENVGFTQQDMYNSNRDRRMKIKCHDGEMLFDHFMNEQEKNPGFIFKPECILHYQQFRECVWDSESRYEFDLR
ncbi:hypothetical protein L3X38_042540 [Prunus dulcis]|uniref:Protein FAR1-RELATED SEQUENCE n=1 Tax=Prunus dulcis TaxID=3755 RepID=A0AAD4UWT9_PRUDU|nr:hypothetical protein L3X38_042540 [Prunus dulcis]